MIALRALTLVTVEALPFSTRSVNRVKGLKVSHFIRNNHQEKVVVFIHGITGDVDETWRNKESGTYWPALLTEDQDFDGFDVYVVSYPTPRFGLSRTIEQIAIHVLGEFDDGGFFARFKHIYFIAHSMGGLIIKRVLISLSTARRVETLRLVRAVLFLSTPSQGSPLARFAAWVTFNPQFADLRSAVSNTFLQSLDHQWEDLLRDRDAAHATFPMSFCAYEVQKKWGLARIVNRVHMKTWADETPRSMELDHGDIVKPSSCDGDPYAWAKAKIRQANDKVEKKKEADDLVVQGGKLRGHDNQAARAAYEKARGLYKSIGCRVGEAHVIRGLAAIESMLGHLDVAKVKYIEARALYTEMHNSRGQGQTLLGIGEMERLLDHHDEARNAFIEADVKFRDADDNHGQAYAALYLAHLERQLNHWDQARTLYEKAYNTYKTLSDQFGQASALLGLGHLGHNEAPTALKKAIELFKANQSPRDAAIGLLRLGKLEGNRKHSDDARKAYLEAREQFQLVNDRHMEGNVLLSLGGLEQRLGRFDDSRKAYKEARDIYHAMKQPSGEANALLGIATVDRLLRRFDEARNGHVIAQDRFKAVNNSEGEADTLRGLAELERQLGRFDEARTAYIEARGIYKSLCNAEGEAQVLLGLGELHRILNNYDKALDSYQKADGLFKSLQNLNGQANVLFCLGLLKQKSNRDVARQHFKEAAGLYQNLGLDDWHATAARALQDISK